MKNLLNIQSELKAPKLNKNTFGKYKYRKAEDIMNALKPLLRKYECVLYMNDDLVEVSGRFYIKATATLIDGESTIQVSGWAREEESKKGMDGSQVTGASSSYARKYALNALFLIDDSADSDTTNTGSKESSSQVLSSAQIKSEIEKVNDVKSLNALYKQNEKLAKNDIGLIELFKSKKEELNGSPV